MVQFNCIGLKLQQVHRTSMSRYLTPEYLLSTGYFGQLLQLLSALFQNCMFLIAVGWTKFVISSLHS
ncbi:hypothetical protein I7I48_12257 [Histoplasma ohiense]|nr:hypothetical protein I7I48_12257 [Histoplasma ohiense (nom. inval.)]